MPMQFPTLFSFILMFGLCLSPPLGAQGDGLEAALDSLPNVKQEDLPALEQRIRRLRSQSGSPSRDLLLDRGRAAIEAGRLDVAIARLSALIDHAPDFAEGYYERAGVYYIKGRYGLSLADLSAVLARSPRHFDAIFLLAATQLNLARYNEALSTLDVLHRIHPNHRGAEALEAEINRQLGRVRL